LTNNVNPKQNYWQFNQLPKSKVHIPYLRYSSWTWLVLCPKNAHLDILVSSASQFIILSRWHQPNQKKLTASSKALVYIEKISTLSECVTKRWSVENQTEVQSPSDEWGKWLYHWGIASLYPGEMLHTEKINYKGKELSRISVLFILFITYFERREVKR